jgi:quinol monooxygenase YgiN
MFMLSLKISSPPGKRSELLKSLKLLTRPVVVEPGCLTCRVYEDIKSRGDFFIIEEWHNQDDLTQHLKTALFRKLLAVAEISDASPQIRCEEMHNTDGVQYIQSLMYANT